MWIEARSGVVFDGEGRIAAIDVEWQFDEYYSTTAIEGLDANGDGKYDPDELVPVARDNIEALEEYRYFTYARADGEALEYGPVTRYRSTYADSMVTLHFTIPLKQPVDPAARTFSYKMYDPTFYIAIDLASRNALSIQGKAPKHCRIEAGKSAADAADASQGESFFAKLTKLDDFGAQFAQPITVTCTPKTAAR